MKTILTIFTFLVCFCASAQDTTYQTYSIQHDTLERTTIPQQIIHTGDSLVLVSDTSYNVYYNNALYSVVDGSVYVTIPLYDTIAAHDSVFICHNCAQHDTTIIVINPTALIIRANDQSKIYGQTFTFTHTGTQVSAVSGLKAGDVITTDDATSLGAAASATAGTYDITLSSVTIMRGATNVTGTYNISYQPGTLTVNQLPITIKAQNQGKTAGQTFVFTHTGTQVDLTSGALASGDAITADNEASTGAASTAAAGTYTITLSSVTIKKGTTDVTSSYSITYVAGTLTVAAAPNIITITAKNQIKTYGQTFTFLNNGSQVQVTSGSLVAGDVITVDNAASTGATSTAAVGSYAITLSAVTIMRGGTNVTGSYTITYQTGTLTVNPINISIQANNQTKTQGTSFTFTHNGTQVSVVSGSLLSGNTITADNAASSGASSGAAAGTYSITLSSVTIMNGGSNVTSNYSITYQPGTLTVTPVTPVQAINGIFPNITTSTGLAVPLSQRINIAKGYACNAFRLKTDVGDAWNVKQVHDSGMIALLTYNDPPCCHLNYFVTGAALETAKVNFENYLSSHLNALPEVISFNNEESNTNYWKGTVYDYMAWLNAATAIAHKYHVAVSNGGTLQPMVYYMRWVYQQEGNTAMVNEINKRGHLNTTTGVYAQAVIDWYKVEIPGIAASQVDYVNIHHYEPSYNLPTNSDTTTGILPLLIKFLHERTGKPVMTNEFGSKYDSQSLFNQECDEFNDNGVKTRVYYYGSQSGPVSDPHPDWWKAWILR